jgi:glycosyltransferase involved in cell wall biosynthesis
VISALYPPTAIGGAETMAKQLVDGLRDQGLDVFVLTLRAPQAPVADEAHIHRVPLQNMYWPYERGQKPPSLLRRLVWHALDTSNPWMVQQVGQWAREKNLDIINTHNLQGFSSGIWPALQTLNLPIVHVLHDFSLLCPRTVLYKNGRVCGQHERRCSECRWLTAPRAKHTDSVCAVVGVSQFILQLHLEHGLFRQARGQVIYNALNPQKNPPHTTKRERTGPLTLGFLGRLDQAKGLDVLLAAADILRLKGFPVQWVLAGKGPSQDIERWQTQYPMLDLQWRGYIEPDTLWPDVDALVFPSNSYEALGNVILEAASAAKACVASRHGGSVELIEEGVSGAFFEPGNAHDLARVIFELDQEHGRWHAMGLQARQKAQAFTAQRRLKQFTDLFEAVHAHRS